MLATCCLNIKPMLSHFLFHQVTSHMRKIKWQTKVSLFIPFTREGKVTLESPVWDLQVVVLSIIGAILRQALPLFLFLAVSFSVKYLNTSNYEAEKHKITFNK